MSTVRLEPIGEEIEVQAGETVLDASFRQGYNLAYGCREGQCSACKCFLLEGDADLKPYSSFALSDTERENGYSLMCRAMPETDLTVELLHYDPESYRLDHAIRDGSGTVEAVESLTADITRLLIKVDTPADFTFTPGQYVDLHVPGDADARRSFSLANLPTAGEPRLELFIKRYPGGTISGLLESGQITVGDSLDFTGPYGAMKNRPGDAPVLMVAGGSGMAPILSLLRELAREETRRPVRFFYGAHTEDDLFAAAEIAAIGEALSDFSYHPLTEQRPHEAVDAFLAETPEFLAAEVYMCGPPPMLEAAEEMLLSTHRFDEQRIYQDKFTTSAQAPVSTGAEGAAAPPAKTFSPDPGAGTTSPEDRGFGWFTPAKRRATLYEDVTVDTQPSIHRHVTRGWPLSFADGRGTWDDNSTKLKSTDWFAFRDPGEQWERTYYVSGNASEQQIEGAVNSAIEEGLLADFRPEWVRFLKDTLQLPAYVEHGLWFATATVARDGLSDSVSTCIALQAAMKQRSAQALVLYAMDLEPYHGEFSMAEAKQTFLEAPEWQPIRRLLERLAATPDWCEVIVAANLCFEPVIGTLLRRELGTRAAAANGDVVTPVLAGVATQEWEWARAWSTALARFLLADPEHGEANREQLSAWVSDWLPEATAAAEALIPLAERIPRGIDIERALAGIRTYAAGVLIEAGLAELTTLLGVEAPVVSDEALLSDAGLAGPASSPTRRVRSGSARRSKVGGAAEANGDVPDLAAAPPLTDAAPPTRDDGSYDFVGIVMAKSAEGDAVAEVMRRREGVVVHEHAAFWDVRAADKLTIPYDDVSEELGYEIDSYSIQHEMSTHYGRMVATDDALILFSDPTEAMQYLMA